ncbi:MAG: hypothetical protein U1E26_09420 [Coriobacteriia bacterium]|nr:hypothetical protein [Coriobacteriia bacterium]
MEITAFAKVLIIMNNYFHDVATAMLFSSALIVWLLGRRVERDGGDAAAWFPGAYATLSSIAKWSIVWIVVGGIPRTIFFGDVEWNMADPSNKYLFTALMIKHALMWIFVIAGSVMWLRIRKVAKATVA